MTSRHEASMRDLSRVLLETAGLQLLPNGSESSRIVARAVARAGASGVDDYAAEVVAGRASIGPLVEESRVGETYFFREPHQLAFLEQELFAPTLAAARPIRLWSAGCASGEEAYSLAMMTVEAGLASEILATDISPAALAVAQRAEYGQWSLRGPAKERARVWLEPREARYTVRPRIRERVTFRVHNLVGARAPHSRSGEGWDAILCRNVLMYFDAETQARVIESLASVLAVGGWLVLASCDPPVAPTSQLLEPLVTEEGVFYRLRSSRAPRATFEPGAIEPVAWTRRVRAPNASPPPPPQTPGAAPERAPDLPAETGRAACLRGFAAMELGARDAALSLLRRALFLEPDLVIAELATAALLDREGDRRSARRGYQRALRLIEQHPPELEVPLASGATHGDLAAHCRRILTTLGEGDVP